MKPEDVPDTLLASAYEAMVTANCGVTNTTVVCTILAAVIPEIRRAALEEAAGAARNIALQWRGQINIAATHSQRTRFADRETGAMTALAAIRALDT
jgi:hypothetical protein